MQSTSFSEWRRGSRSLEPSYQPRRDWILLAAIGALTVSFLVFTIGHSAMPTPDDVELYYQYANRVLGGELPYRDFNIEYPPFSLPFFILPAIISNFFGAFSPVRYVLIFQAEAFLLAVGTLIFVWKLMRTLYPTVNLNWRLGFFTASALVFSLYIFRRFDMAAVFLVVVAFYFIYKRNPGWGGAFLGLAAAAKLYPAILLPIVLLYFWRNRNDKEFALRFGVGFCFAGGVTVLPFVITGLPGILNFLKYHGERGVQIESIFASIIYTGKILGFTNVTTSVDHGSINFASSWVGFLASVATLLTVGGLLLFYAYLWWATRTKGRRLRIDWLLQAAAIATMWFIISNKVLSPQYLLWIMPFAVLWRGSKLWIYFTALALSFLAFPFMVLGIVALDWQPMLVIMVRNILLICLFGLMLKDFVRITGLPTLPRKFNAKNTALNDIGVKA